jgi:hypothetical protein
VQHEQIAQAIVFVGSQAVVLRHVGRAQSSDRKVREESSDAGLREMQGGAVERIDRLSRQQQAVSCPEIPGASTDQPLNP